ncbi:hypothetical protein FDT66_06230 [Polaribacter aestuariivivens]|uniref:DUF6705 domain-containing protein n=1 Tax=Polaribacter aestuariivivens TaxID=2304626 RepID=A0A5S3N4Z2_9FLAO|nr:DUF6705 family protein [Polaribacter aestuariivivens]TMM30355.1 hypothetical protein FDT66_06230 [Polaribacter aestuariivivens]
MKTIIFTLLIVTAISCKAQTPIVGLDAPSNTPKGAYYKDLTNELDKFVGTWKFENTNEQFLITLKKKDKYFIAPDYHDILIGEYVYNKNRVEIVNTLSNFGGKQIANLGGAFIVKPNERPKCISCTSNERRIEMYFNDPERDYLQSTIVLRFIPNSNPQKLSAVIYSNDSIILPYDDAPQEPRVPYGEYLLIKQ